MELSTCGTGPYSVSFTIWSTFDFRLLDRSAQPVYISHHICNRYKLPFNSRPQGTTHPVRLKQQHAKKSCGMLLLKSLEDTKVLAGDGNVGQDACNSFARPFQYMSCMNAKSPLTGSHRSEATQCDKQQALLLMLLHKLLAQLHSLNNWEGSRPDKEN